jgi:hypothetical protein
MTRIYVLGSREATSSVQSLCQADCFKSKVERPLDHADLIPIRILLRNRNGDNVTLGPHEGFYFDSSGRCIEIKAAVLCDGLGIRPSLIEVWELNPERRDALRKESSGNQNAVGLSVQ